MKLNQQTENKLIFINDLEYTKKLLNSVFEKKDDRFEYKVNK